MERGIEVPDMPVLDMQVDDYPLVLRVSRA